MVELTLASNHRSSPGQGTNLSFMAYARSKTRVFPERMPSSMASGERDARRSHNSSHAQDFLILGFRELRNQHAHVFQKLHFFQGRVGAQLGECYLPGQAVKRS